MGSIHKFDQETRNYELMSSSIKALTPWVKLTETTVGRDKIYRTLQYFCRFLSFYLAQRGFSKTSIEKIIRLSVALSTARKCPFICT